MISLVSCSWRLSPSCVRLAAGLLLAVLLTPSVALAQPARSWSVLYDSGAGDQAGCPNCETSYLGLRSFVRGKHAAAADAAGNLYVTGTSSGETDDVLTVKYDSQGVEKWAVSYNGGDADSGFAVAVDGSGNVYVAGRTFVESQYGFQGQMLVLKYNAAGVQQWAVTNRMDVASAGFAIAVDASGNVFVAGEHYTTSDYVSMVTVKLNASGIKQWTKWAFFGFDYEESTAYDLALDSSGNAHVTGFLYKPGEPDQRDYLTVKYSPTGSQLWIKAFDSGASDEAYDVAVDGSGNVHVAGTSGVVRYSSTGVQQWAAPFSGIAHALINVGTSIYAVGASGTDAVAARYDGTGTLVWSTPYNLGGTEKAFALRLVGDNLYVAGSAGADALVVGFDNATGGATWSDVYNGGGSDTAYAMAFSGTGDFWVAGTSGSDLLTLKYSTQTGPTLLGLTLTPNAFAGACKTSSGKVTLSGPAPAGGAVVALANTNPAAGVPQTVTVPAGATTGKFTITGTAVSQEVSGVVTASYGGTSQSATLKVRPIGVATLVLSPNPVVGPNPVTGTVTLECPATSGGILVTLASSATSVARTNVASLTIAVGSQTGTFGITTTDVAAVSYSNIRATANGIWRSVKLTVNP